MEDRTSQYNTIEYSTVQHDTITHKITYNTQGSSLYAKLQKEIKNTYTIKTQKRLEPEVVNQY